jgi:hypothetical protein
MELSLAAALKAKIPAERIINFLSLGDLTAWIARVRSKAGARGRSGKTRSGPVAFLRRTH